MLYDMVSAHWQVLMTTLYHVIHVPWLLGLVGIKACAKVYLQMA